MKTKNTKLSGCNVLRCLLIILAILALVFSAYGYIRAAGINSELRSMGMSGIKVDDLIGQTTRIESCTGRSLYEDMTGISRLEVTLISGRSALLLISPGLLACSWIIRSKQTGYWIRQSTEKNKGKNPSPGFEEAYSNG